MMTAETDAWIASLGAVAILNPRIVVTGHKIVGAPDSPESVVASQQYLRDFTRGFDKSAGPVDAVAFPTVVTLHQVL